MSVIQVNEVLDTWEAITDAGRRASEDLDKGRWLIGDLAVQVGTSYGEDLIDDFAKEIGQQKKTVQGYRRVAIAFPKSLRVETFVKYPNLFYSHYRTAASLGKPEEFEERLAWLEEVSSNGWTTDEAARHLADAQGKLGPKKIADTAAFVSRVKGVTASLEFNVEVADRLLDQVGKTIRVVIYEVKPNERV